MYSCVNQSSRVRYAPPFTIRLNKLIDSELYTSILQGELHLHCEHALLVADMRPAPEDQIQIYFDLGICIQKSHSNSLLEYNPH